MTEIVIERGTGRDKEPQLLFTALDISRELGTSDRNLNQSWFPKLEEVFYWDIDSMKTGSRYTAIARERFIELQLAISPKIPLRNSDNLIVRNDDGKPLMVSNPNKLGIKEYKHQTWAKFDKFPGKSRADAPTEKEIVEGEICDESDLVLFEGGLSTIEDIGSNVDDFFSLIDQAADTNANAIVGAYAQRLSQKVSIGIKDIHENLGKAVNSKSRRKS